MAILANDIPLLKFERKIPCRREERHVEGVLLKVDIKTNILNVSEEKNNMFTDKIQVNNCQQRKTTEPAELERCRSVWYYNDLIWKLWLWPTTWANLCAELSFCLAECKKNSWLRVLCEDLDKIYVRARLLCMYELFYAVIIIIIKAKPFKWRR